MDYALFLKRLKPFYDCCNKCYFGYSNLPMRGIGEIISLKSTSANWKF